MSVRERETKRKKQRFGGVSLYAFFEREIDREF